MMECNKHFVAQLPRRKDQDPQRQIPLSELIVAWLVRLEKWSGVLCCA